MTKTFRVLSYKDSAGFFERDGVVREIHCDHYREQDLGMNNVGEIVPLPTSSVPPLLTGTDFQHATVMIPQTTENPSPTGSGDANFVAVTKIKDRVTLVTTYVDTVAYNTAVEACNGCCIQEDCPPINLGSLSYVNNGDGTITVSWDEVIGVIGYDIVTEELHELDCNSQPTDSGYDFTENNGVTIPVTEGSGYCFFIRTSCQRGVKGVWSVFKILIACSSPSSVTVTGITTTTAHGNWVSLPVSVQYQFAVQATIAEPIYVADVAAGLNTVLLNRITATSALLVANTTYYFYLRNYCPSGSTSAWTIVPFTTAP